jgi:hypothetical protein
MRGIKVFISIEEHRSGIAKHVVYQNGLIAGYFVRAIIASVAGRIEWLAYYRNADNTYDLVPETFKGDTGSADALAAILNRAEDLRPV